MSSSQCPLCKSSRNVCSVADVINDGIHVSSTQGVSIGMFGSDEFSQMYFTTTSQSRLSQLLSPPRKPFGIYWLPIFILSAMGYYTFKYAFDAFGEQADTGVLGFMFTLILGLFFSIVSGPPVGTLCYLVVLLVYRSERKRWKRNCEILYSSSYCVTDGVVFDAESNVYSPSNYVDFVFSQS